MKQIKKYFHIPFATFLCVLLFTSFLIANGQTDDIPAPPNPPRLVDDFAGFLTPGEQNQLERKLVAFDDSTSTQIAIVVVKSLNGYDVNDFATRIIEKWGIGRKDKNNGILILVKPKTQNEQGQVAISTGYGIESFVNDALSKRIIEQEILPSFRNGNYYQGLDKALNVLISLTRGEFTADQYLTAKKRNKGTKFPVAVFVIIIALIVSFVNRSSSGRTKHLSSSSKIPFWLLLITMLGSDRSSGSGSFGDFSSGGGGFGGFGGGTGGGGGASGSW